jgi:hypothetical protein
MDTRLGAVLWQIYGKPWPNPHVTASGRLAALSVVVFCGAMAWCTRAEGRTGRTFRVRRRRSIGSNSPVFFDTNARLGIIFH